MKKLIRRIILAAALLIVLVVAVVFFGAGILAKMGLEKGATYALGVPTTVKSLHLGLLSGKLTIEGLKVANPEGFPGPYFMQSGRFDVQVQPSSLFSDTIVLDRFELDGLDIVFSQKLSGSNASKIMANLDRLSSGSKGQPATGKGRKIKVDKVLVRNVTAHFDLLPGLSPTGPVTVKVPEIELDGVASDQSGLAVGQLIAKLVPAILRQVLSQAKGVVPGNVLHDLDKAIPQEAIKAVQKVGKVLKLGDGVDLKKLFNPGADKNADKNK